MISFSSLWMYTSKSNECVIVDFVTCRYPRMEICECRTCILMEWWYISEYRTHISLEFCSEVLYRYASYDSCEHLFLRKRFFFDIVKEFCHQYAIASIFRIYFSYFKKLQSRAMFYVICYVFKKPDSK